MKNSTTNQRPGEYVVADLARLGTSEVLRGFCQSMKAVSRFVEMNEAYIPYLVRKVQLIKKYLQQH